jgi:hypothetical protein
VWGISKDGKRGTFRPSDKEQSGCGGNDMGEVYKADITSSINLKCGTNVIDYQACGNAISPAGKYISYFGDTKHESIAFKTWEGGSGGSTISLKNVCGVSSFSSRPNRNRWSSNSEDWLCIYYNNTTQALVKRDGSECIKVNSSGSRMPGDFWVGTPPQCDGSVAKNCPSCDNVAVNTNISVRQDRSGLVHVTMPGAVGTIEIVDMTGRIIAASSIENDAAAFANLTRGVYLARAQTRNQSRISTSFLAD